MARTVWIMDAVGRSPFPCVVTVSVGTDDPRIVDSIEEAARHNDVRLERVDASTATRCGFLGCPSVAATRAIAGKVGDANVKVPVCREHESQVMRDHELFEAAAQDGGIVIRPRQGRV